MVLRHYHFMEKVNTCFAPLPYYGKSGINMQLLQDPLNSNIRIHHLELDV